MISLIRIHVFRSLFHIVSQNTWDRCDFEIEKKIKLFLKKIIFFIEKNNFFLKMFLKKSEKSEK